MQKRRSDAEAERASCDVLIKRFDSTLDPNEIQPIRAAGMKRGALMGEIREYLKNAAPNSVSTKEVAIAIQVILDLPEMANSERVEWQTNSVRPSLRRLEAHGMIARISPTEDSDTPFAYWRWVTDKRKSTAPAKRKDLICPATLTLDELRAQAESS